MRNLRVPRCALAAGSARGGAEDLVCVDVTLTAGKITHITAAGGDKPAGLDMGQRMVWPLTVDCHTHIDKGHVWPRSPNPDGTFEGALSAAGTDLAAHQTPADVRARANFALAAAYAHGTGLVRSHVDCASQGFDRRFAVLRELAQEWSGRVDVQLCPFSSIPNDLDGLNRMARAVRQPHGAALSFFLQARPGLAADLRRVMRFALTHDLNLDFHADETLDPTSNCLETLARAASEAGFERPILVGHCCALSVQDRSCLRRTLDLVAQTPITIAALPLCNMYLQDRTPGRAPRLRGIAPLHEIAAHGIPVALASDNTRDAFYAYGDLDVPELFRDALRMMQLDHPVGDWPATVTTAATHAIGAADKGRLCPGAPADLILFSARNWSEFAARPAADRIVLRAGRPIETTPPDFAQLDTLTGVSP